MNTINLADWDVLFPASGDNIYGSIYSGTHSVYDRSPVADITRDRIARIVAVDVTEGDYAETNLALMVELTDGTWATCMAWCDTTGWDCQSGVEWKWARTRADAVFSGLDREARRRLGVSLPDEANQ